ncbi:transposase [Spartinivicinus ruber]|uniref:transposase n=1 Tax=Spartinivicinus ruber TaxID=2683272 RepID=UPI0038B6784F
MKQYGNKVRNFKGERFWVRGYIVSTVGLDEKLVREYIRNQDSRDQYFDQMNLSL